MVNPSPEASSIPLLKLNLSLEDNHWIVLLVVPRTVKPPESAVVSVAPPVENTAPEADPEPPAVWSIVTVVPLTALTIPPEASVTVPPPLSSVIATQVRCYLYQLHS